MMSEKFLEFMELQSKYGASVYFLDDLISNNEQISSKTGKILPIAERIQDYFRASCREIIEINDKPGLPALIKDDLKDDINKKLTSNIAQIINKNILIKSNAKINERIIAQNMINSVFKPLVETASEINSILNKSAVI